MNKNGYLNALKTEEKIIIVPEKKYEKYEDAMARIQEIIDSNKIIPKKKIVSQEELAFVDEGSDPLYWLQKDMIYQYKDFGFFEDEDFAKFLDVIVSNIKVHKIDDDDTDDMATDFEDNGGN
jgi:hypothetical protein